MRKRYIILAILATLTLIVPVALVTQAQKPSQTVVQAPKPVPLNADTIFTLVNKERTQRGLKPLVRDARLDATAQAKADEMVRLNYFGHKNPNTGTNTAWDDPIFNQLCSDSSENIGETIGYPDNNVQKVKGWMNSKAHHDAILRADYTLTGVAVSGNKVVQHFCVSK